MGRVLHRIIILCSIIFGSYALSCRSEGGHRVADFKKIYNSCLKQQGNIGSDGNRHTPEQDWRDRGQIRNKDHKTGYRDGDRSENKRGNRDRGRDENDERNRMDSRESMYNNNDNYSNMNRYNNMDRTNDRNNRERDIMSRFGREHQGNDRNDQLSGRDDFLESEELDDDSSSSSYHNEYTRRYKRERRLEMNSGQRSQYNPNLHNTNGSENSNASKRGQDKTCAIHCLMENLQMTGDSGKPDRYLVTHAITKDVKNEDLRDFLQESIEECFQILDNENTEDKCEFSKNILLCLSEKGRANCDDWQDDFKF